MNTMITKAHLFRDALLSHPAPAEKAVIVVLK